MLKIGLTGGIACGKSTVLALFKENNAETIDCDDIVGELYSRKEVSAEIEKKFGTADKKELSEIVFSDSAKRKQLEEILHPLVRSELEQRIQALEKRGCKIVVVDVPLLFEAGWQGIFDKTVAVKCLPGQQLARLKKKGFSETNALDRISSQLPIDEKIIKADYSIDNSRSIDFAEDQILRLLRNLNA